MKKTYQDAMAKYEKEQREYPQKLKQYKQQLAAWETAGAKHQRELALVDQNYQRTLSAYTVKGNHLLKGQQELLDDTRQSLEALYALDWLYPKYRTLPAVTTICEYFQSGRCSELTGPDGAYNLYESELRQNIIIGKLENIEHKLDQIIQNQYMLYAEMQKSNQIASEIAQNTKNILKQTEEIAWNTKCTAYFSEITARNTEAIKIISLINGARR